MKTNATRAERIAQSLSKLARSIGPLIASNPGSKVYYSVGLLILALAGVGLYLWFSGYSNVYFFGMLSLTTLVPMAIYGICMMYEGWNNSSINDLRKTLLIVEEEKEKKIAELEIQMGRLTAIVKESKEALTQFKESWVKHREAEGEKKPAFLGHHSPLQNLDLTNKVASDFMQFLLALFPSVNESELTSGIRRQAASTLEYVQKSSVT